MATKYGINATKRAVTQPPERPEQGQVKADVLFAYDKYTLSSDLAAADVIKMMKLPEGARIIDAILVCDDLDASGGTLDVGWESNGSDAADADGMFANVDVTSASVTRMSAAVVPGVFQKFAAETQISITVDGDTDATSGDIELGVWFVID